MVFYNSNRKVTNPDSIRAVNRIKENLKAPVHSDAHSLSGVLERDVYILGERRAAAACC